jgi:hypothetical protein
MTNPDNLVHAFRTPFGLPADKATPPACGAKLTDAYDWQKKERKNCPKCVKLVKASMKPSTF